MTATADRMGISGRIARFFLTSQLTPLLALVAFLLGVFAVLVTAALLLGLYGKRHELIGAMGSLLGVIWLMLSPVRTMRALAISNTD